MCVGVCLQNHALVRPENRTPESSIVRHIMECALSTAGGVLKIWAKFSDHLMNVLIQWYNVFHYTTPEHPLNIPWTTDASRGIITKILNRNSEIYFHSNIYTRYTGILFDAVNIGTPLSVHFIVTVTTGGDSS